MDTYSVVKFVHICFLLLGFGGAGVISLCLFRLKAAQSLEEAGPWGVLAGQAEKVFPVAIVGLFASGAYLTSDAWTWSTHWVDVSIAGLVVIALQGPLLAGRRAHLLKHALMENGPGPLRGKALAHTADPLLWLANFANIGIVVGVVWNMTQKAGTGTSIAAVVAGYGVGAALGVRLSRRSAVEAAPAGEGA